MSFLINTHFYSTKASYIDGYKLFQKVGEHTAMNYKYAAMRVLFHTTRKMLSWKTNKKVEKLCIAIFKLCASHMEINDNDCDLR